MKGKVSTAPQGKFLVKLFLKSLSRAAGETAVARRNERNASFGLFFLQSFFFWPFCVKRKSVMDGESERLSLLQGIALFCKEIRSPLFSLRNGNGSSWHNLRNCIRTSFCPSSYL
jgi:hypothetical protein